MTSRTALSSGIMSHESTWCVVAFLKKYLVRVVTELADHTVVGSGAWADAIAGMHTWNTGTILAHISVPSPSLYRTTASHYVLSTLPESIQNGRTRIPSFGVFAKAFVHHASECHAVRGGGIVATIAAQDQDTLDHVVTDLMRLALASAFDKLPATGKATVGSRVSTESRATAPVPLPTPAKPFARLSHLDSISVFHPETEEQMSMELNNLRFDQKQPEQTQKKIIDNSTHVLLIRPPDDTPRPAHAHGDAVDDVSEFEAPVSVAQTSG